MAQPGETNIKLTDKLPESLEDSIKKIAEKQNFITYEIVSKNLSTDGGSYMGVLYEINIKGKTVDGAKEVNIFAKNIVDNQDMPIYSIPGVFKTESWVYTELFDIFTQLQEEAKIPENERFKTPYSFEECNPTAIIMENLGKKGYKIYPRMDIFSIEYAEMCIKELAKFHALSFVIKSKKPAYYDDVIIKQKQPYVFCDEYYAFVKNISAYSINCLEPAVKEKVGDILLKKADEYPKYISDTSSVCTLCHGDYKLNNIMAKEVDGKLTEVVTIDYQILHYGSPIQDFVYFIFHGTDQEFRKNHLNHLKNLYYETMEGFLQKFNLEIEDFFPKDVFEKEYKAKLDFGLIVNVFFTPFLFAAEGDAPDVTSEDLSTIQFNIDKRFDERFRGVVDDFIQWGYI